MKEREKEKKALEPWAAVVPPLGGKSFSIEALIVPSAPSLPPSISRE